MNHFEIEACVIRAKNGNKEELLKLLEQYKPFIIKTASGYSIKGFDMYDMIQIGYVTLINAVSKYRVGSNTFSTYAFNSIKNALRYTLRQNFKQSQDMSLNAPLDSSGEFVTEFMDLVESDEDLEEYIIKREELFELKKAVSRLPFDEIELIVMIYYTGLSLKKYAEKKGLSYQQAVRKRDRILRKLRVEPV
jgi:RNA polymerase sporulation-specific sigma factor